MSLGFVDLSHPELPIVMLNEAYLCSDCTAITAAPEDICPRCGSRSLLRLAKVLDREERK